MGLYSDGLGVVRGRLHPTGWVVLPGSPDSDTGTRHETVLVVTQNTRHGLVGGTPREVRVGDGTRVEATEDGGRPGPGREAGGVGREVTVLGAPVTAEVPGHPVVNVTTQGVVGPEPLGRLCPWSPGDLPTNP